MPIVTQFVGVDDAAFGDGDDDTLPVDTWLQRRLQHNIEAIATVGRGVSMTPASASGDNLDTLTGLRPYAAGAWHTVWVGWVQVVADQGRLRVTIAYHADVPGTEGDMAGEVELRITCDDNSRTQVILPNTYDDGVKCGHVTILHSLATRSTESKAVKVSISVRSASATAVYTTIGEYGTGLTDKIGFRPMYSITEALPPNAPGYWSPNGATPAPGRESRECMYWEKASELYGGGMVPRADLIMATETSAFTFAQCVDPVSAFGSGVTFGTARMHQCFFLRAIHIESVIAPTQGDPVVPIATSVRQDPLALAPNRVFDSVSAMRQAHAVRQIALRPVLAAVGPRGRKSSLDATRKDMDQFAYYNYAAHWPFVLGDYDGVTTGEETQLVADAFYLRTERPWLELRCLWLSVQHGAEWNQRAMPGTEKGTNKPAFELEEGPGAAEWDLTVRVDQMIDAPGVATWAGDSAMAATIEERLTIPVHGANAASSNLMAPVLRGADASQQASIKNPSAPPGFWFREGSLFPSHGDMDLLHQTVHVLRLSGNAGPAQLARPWRLSIDTVLSNFVDPLRIGLVGDALAESLRLMLVGYALIEHPAERIVVE